MVIQLDRCYKICFKNEKEGAGANFTLLDGFYEVVRSYGWNELMSAGIDLQANLLDYVGITDTTLIKTLQVNWINDAFYRCIGMDSKRQIWVPESIIKGYPDPRIGSYKKLGLIMDLGVFANKEDFSTLGKDIMNYLKSKYGIDRPDATVMVYGNQWMTVEDYQNTDLSRKSMQGLAYTTENILISASNELRTIKLDFQTPPFISGSEEQVIEGALSESVHLTYGIDLVTLPQGNEDADYPCWYYTDECILLDNSKIEQSISPDYNGVILKSIFIKTNFKKDRYRWMSETGHAIFSRDITPNESSPLFTDSTLEYEYTHTGLTYNAETNSITVVTDSGTTVYTFDKPENATEVRVGYRYRNAKPKIQSSYSQALKYAYENIELKQRIAALESLLANGQ